jgi:hypothetical protein
MRKAGFIISALLLFAGVANAQVPTSGNVFFGYSFYNTDLSPTNRSSLNGWEGSLEGKIIPWVGIVADFGGYYGSGVAVCIPGGCSNLTAHEESFLFGPRVSMSFGKIRPFAEALFGGSHINTNGAGADTSFATALGGGIDYKIIRPIALRVQGDYVQTRFFAATQNNVRVSTGIVFRF